MGISITFPSTKVMTNQIHSSLRTVFEIQNFVSCIFCVLKLEKKKKVSQSLSWGSSNSISFKSKNKQTKLRRGTYQRIANNLSIMFCFLHCYYVSDPQTFLGFLQRGQAGHVDIKLPDKLTGSPEKTDGEAGRLQRGRTRPQIERSRIKATEVGFWWHDALMYLTRWAIKPLHPAPLSERTVESTFLSCSLEC